MTFWIAHSVWEQLLINGTSWNWKTEKLQYGKGHHDSDQAVGCRMGKDLYNAIIMTKVKKTNDHLLERMWRKGSICSLGVQTSTTTLEFSVVAPQRPGNQFTSRSIMIVNRRHQ